MSLKDVLACRVVKASLRVSFKLPSHFPLPPEILRKGMEQGAQLFSQFIEAADSALDEIGLFVHKSVGNRRVEPRRISVG